MFDRNCFTLQCCELLDILGIPYVQSQGEAEAMCALLNAAGVGTTDNSGKGPDFLTFLNSQIGSC